MTKVTYSPIYETLKSSFRNGIEFKTQPLKSYVGNELAKPIYDKEVMANVVMNLLKGVNPLKMLEIKAKPFEVDWNEVGEIVAMRNTTDRILYKGRTKIEDTFYKGQHNPDVCIMAWYDALAEHVISKAEALTGKKAPIPVIQKELDMIGRSLSRNFDFAKAKSAVFDKLKQMYPKTYKTRLKIIEQSYNKKIETAVDNIVRVIVQGA